MKRILFFTTAALALLFSISIHAKDRLIEFSKLPAVTQEFIQTNFSGITCLSIILDQEGLDKDYTVNLEDGTCIEFDRKGNWESIRNIKGVDSKFLPAKAAEYITTKFSGQLIVEISFDPTDLDAYEVKLYTRMELKFTKDGSFLSVEI